MPGEQIDSAFYSRLSIYASVTTSPGHALVVGAGIFGLATSLELRTRGWAVTLLDPGPLPHKSASSTDVSKMVRMDYGSDLFYHEFAEAALEGWDRWNADWPYPPYHETGLLVFSGEEIKPGSFEYESAQALQERGYEPEWLVPKPIPYLGGRSVFTWVPESTSGLGREWFRPVPPSHARSEGGCRSSNRYCSSFG